MVVSIKRVTKDWFWKKDENNLLLDVILGSTLLFLKGRIILNRMFTFNQKDIHKNDFYKLYMYTETVGLIELRM